MNAAYRSWERTLIYPTHYACLDEIVGLSHADAICKLVKNSEVHGIEAFLLRDNLIRSRPFLGTHARVFSYEKVFSNIPPRLRDLVTTGSHAALWLTTLGYEQIVLLGIDANYVETVKMARSTGGDKLKIVGSGKNPNYYFNDYQKTGDEFLKPNPVPGVHTGAWRRVAQHLASTTPSVQLLNGSPISNIDCTDFIDIRAFLKSGSSITSPETVFSDQQRQKHRQAYLQLSEGSQFSLAKFIDWLSFLKYHQYVGQEQYISELSRFGWTNVPISKLRSQWGLISYTGSDFLDSFSLRNEESAIVVISSGSTDEMHGAVNRLRTDYDTVLKVYISKNCINIAPLPSGTDKLPMSLVAFKRERFSQSELQTALDAAVSVDYCGKHKFRRRLFHRVSVLKHAINSGLRR